MLTRRAISRQEENRLQITLQELKISKELYAQLNNERDENGKEVLEVLKSNDKLKSQLSKLYNKKDEVEEEHYRLQLLVNQFDECNVEYEQALRCPSTLEQELRDDILTC